jgi:hypothetical protein
MKELLLYINTLKQIIDSYYEKEVVFYNIESGTWYSREHSREISHEELTNWAWDLVWPHIKEINEY